MRTDVMYEEKTVSMPNAIILGVPAAIMLVLFTYQVLVGPLGTDPAPDLLFLVMFLVFFVCAVNFGRLVVRVTPSSVSVGYGIFKHNIPLDTVEDCSLDTASAIRYGGWGIRLGRVGGRWRLAYSTIEGSRVLLSLREGRFREFVFSTRNPDEVIGIIMRSMVGGRRA